MHSGVIGGSVHEAMTDLVRLLGSLVDGNGRILVPGIDSQVAPVTEAERKAYAAIEFDLEACVEIAVPL